MREFMQPLRELLLTSDPDSYEYADAYYTIEDYTPEYERLLGRLQSQRQYNATLPKLFAQNRKVELFKIEGVEVLATIQGSVDVAVA